MRTSSKWRSAFFQNGSGGAALSSLGPEVARRAAASSEARPSGVVASWLRTSSGPVVSDTHVEVRLGARSLRVRYPGTGRWIAPEGFTAEFRRGEVTALIGPSGSGKSTLTLALAGLIPHSLQAELQGMVYAPAGTPPRVGILFQDPDSQVITGSVLDEVCFGLENHLVPGTEIEPRALTALQTVGLPTDAQFVRRDPFTLSGGQRQRLALAAVLALEPDVVILDEPTANLDPPGREEVHRLLPRLAAGGRAVVVVEHALDSLVDHVDRVIALDARADVIAEGSARDIFTTHLDVIRAHGISLPTSEAVAEAILPGSGAVSAADAAALLREHVATPAVLDAETFSSDPVLRAVEVTYELAGRQLLTDVNIQAHPGQIVAVLGRNGAGKTTLLRLLAGVVSPTTGRIELDSKDIDNLSAAQIASRLAMVFQNPEHQFVAHTAGEDLAHGLHVRGQDPAQVHTAVTEMLQRFRLTEYRDVSPFALSHGQKRRLSVGGALITQPAVVLLDEPTYGQDERGTTELLRYLDVLRSQGVAVVMVTHDLQLVADHADTVILLADGRMVGQGAAADMLTDAAALAVAGLPLPPVAALGHMAGRPDVYSMRQLETVPVGDAR